MSSGLLAPALLSHVLGRRELRAHLLLSVAPMQVYEVIQGEKNSIRKDNRMISKNALFLTLSVKEKM